jgi:hypothetical protein
MDTYSSSSSQARARVDVVVFHSFVLSLIIFSSSPHRVPQDNDGEGPAEQGRPKCFTDARQSQMAKPAPFMAVVVLVVCWG